MAHTNNGSLESPVLISAARLRRRSKFAVNREAGMQPAFRWRVILRLGSVHSTVSTVTRCQWHTAPLGCGGRGHFITDVMCSQQICSNCDVITLMWTNTTAKTLLNLCHKGLWQFRKQSKPKVQPLDCKLNLRSSDKWSDQWVYIVGIFTHQLFASIVTSLN